MSSLISPVLHIESRRYCYYFIIIMIIVMESTEILIMIATAGINDNDNNMILILVKTFFPKVQRIGKVGEISYDS